LVIHRECGNIRSEATVLCTLGDLEAGCDRWDQAAQLYRDSIARFGQAQDAFLEAWVMADLAVAEAMLGRHQAAREGVLQAIEGMRARDAKLGLALAFCKKGRIHLAAQERQGAVESLGQAKELALSLAVGPKSELALAVQTLEEGIEPDRD
jgi:tetratricopeptide (TPR) repeat protein